MHSLFTLYSLIRQAVNQLLLQAADRKLFIRKKRIATIIQLIVQLWAQVEPVVLTGIILLLWLSDSGDSYNGNQRVKTYV